MKISIEYEDYCRLIVRTEGDHKSASDMRDTWRLWTTALARMSPCHLVVIPGSGLSTLLPLDQQINIMRGAAEAMSGIRAFAYVINCQTPAHHVFNTGYLKGLGINLETFPTFEAARDWLDTQPHRKNCPRAK